MNVIQSSHNPSYLWTPIPSNIKELIRNQNIGIIKQRPVHEIIEVKGGVDEGGNSIEIHVLGDVWLVEWPYGTGLRVTAIIVHLAAVSRY